RGDVDQVSAKFLSASLVLIPLQHGLGGGEQVADLVVRDVVPVGALVDELADALNLGLQLALVVQVLAHGRSEAAQLLLQRLGHSLRQHGGEGCTCVRLGIVLAVDAPGRAALAAHGARAQLVYDRPRRLLDPFGGHVLGAHRLSPRCARTALMPAYGSPSAWVHARSAASCAWSYTPPRASTSTSAGSMTTNLARIASATLSARNTSCPSAPSASIASQTAWATVYSGSGSGAGCVARNASAAA